MIKVFVFAIAALAALVPPAWGKTRILVLASDAVPSNDVLLKHVAETVASLTPGDRLFVYRARPMTQIAVIAPPSDPGMNRARANAALAAQFRPVKEFLSTPPAGHTPEPPGNLMLPSLVDELGRNLLPSLPDKDIDVLVVGSLIYFDPNDARSAMTDRQVPSDGIIFRTARGEWPFSIAGSERRLSRAVMHYCQPNAANDYESIEHEERVRRFWSLWTTGQGGRVGTFANDLQVCFARFRAGESSGQTEYKAVRDAKPEMQRMAARMPAVVPQSLEKPGDYFLLEDVPISSTAPASSRGVAWIGIRWYASCDLDLWARGEPSNPWLYFGSVKTTEGRFNKDFVTSTGDAQMEYIAFSREIDLQTAEVAVNLYSCDGAVAPEGQVRVWFAGKVFQSPFKLLAKTGNKGTQPMQPPHWVRIDLRKVVGLVKE
jgi:hypothetical protein